MQDRLHEPYRRDLVPGLEEVRAAALANGALGAALSGAGPTVLAMVESRAEEVAAAMRDAWRQMDITSRSWVLEIERNGAQVESL